jgi:hypothetical protein
MDFNDYSVKEPYNSDQAEYIKRKIREKIRQSSSTIVYLSKSTAASEWVDWEIRESHRQGKRIVAMYQGDTPPKNMPSVLNELGIKPISWSHEEVMAALE